LEFVVQSISGEADRADRPDEFFGIEVVSEERVARNLQTPATKGFSRPLR
jgi:hypothetical protein